ncbi:hypothetical protein [Methyloceanibacter sp.]|uniref:hypothetical protein n=1 Tax=Methyloceanibacter sp. TaxID=1965321 RepID=UPI003D6C9734
MDSAPILALILVVDFAITSLHSYQEWKGVGAPLWRNFGAIAGLDVPDNWGFLLFTVLLTLILFAIGFVGITGRFGPCLTAAALGALIGARLSDTIVSHLLLYTVGYRPNPGLSSTPLYVLEACFIGWAFSARLAAQPGAAIFGVVGGVLMFVVVLPGLRLVRQVIPAWKRDPWSSWQPIPSWASTNPAAPTGGDVGTD